MRIRDALESDAEALTALTDRPKDVLLDMIHDRSVRVATPEREGGDDETSDAGDSASVKGFIAFDVRSGTVHITDFGGSKKAVQRLFEEPQRFAVRESMDLEVVVADSDTAGVNAVEAAGFDPVESGPRFGGESTTRFRLDPAETE